MRNENREELRFNLERLLTDAYDRLQLRPSALVQVRQYIDNYEFGLAYELILYELREQDLPAGTAEDLKAAAIMMGFEKRA